MTLITWITLAYAAVLVAALALTLIGILYYLLRVNRAVADIRLGLEQVRDATTGLGEPLRQLAAACAESLETFTTAATTLDGAADHVERLAEPFGVRQPTQPRRGLLWKLRSTLSGG